MLGAVWEDLTQKLPCQRSLSDSARGGTSAIPVTRRTNAEKTCFIGVCPGWWTMLKQIAIRPRLNWRNTQSAKLKALSSSSSNLTVETSNDMSSAPLSSPMLQMEPIKVQPPLEMTVTTNADEHPEDHDEQQHEQEEEEDPAKEEPLEMTVASTADDLPDDQDEGEGQQQEGLEKEEKGESPAEKPAKASPSSPPKCVTIHRAYSLPPQADVSDSVRLADKRNRRVSFHKVQIRRYSMTLGDNPACQMGAPVTLDWMYDELPPLDLDDFELTRFPQRRRNLRQLILNMYQRERILQGMGHSGEEVRQAEKQVAKVRWQRSQTVMLLPISKLEEMAQSAKRKVKRRLGAGSSSSGSNTHGGDQPHDNNDSEEHNAKSIKRQMGRRRRQRRGGREGSSEGIDLTVANTSKFLGGDI